MNKKPKNIEQLYSESFNDFRLEPSSGLWKKISTKLAWRNFFTFNPTAFNVYYVAGILALSVAGALWLTKPASDDNQIVNEITVNNERRKAEGGRQKEEGNIQKPLTSIKPEGIGQKQDSSIKNTATQQPASSANSVGQNRLRRPKSEVLTKEDNQKSALSAEALAKVDSSAIVTTKSDLSTVVSSTAEASAKAVTKVDNLKLKSGINDQSNQQPATSNQQPVTPKALFDIYPKNPLLPTDPVTFLNLSKNAVRCQWSFGDSESSDEFEPTHFYKKADNYNIKLKVWSEDGTVDSLVINYEFANSAYMIEFPNAFTPNSNGPTNGYYTPGAPNNDVFHPEHKGVTEYHLEIYNRRGELIFECNDINIGWDGYINSHLATQGVYVWKARGKYSNGQNFIEAGNVMLIIK